MQRRPRASRERSPVLALSSALALCAVFVAGCGGERAAAGEQRASGPGSVTLAERFTAEAREAPITLELDATLAADEESRVTSVVAGRVMEVLVERGAIVAEGDPLVRLRDVDFRLSARSARASVEQAEARLGMGDGSAVPEPSDTPEVRAAQTDLEVAESALRRAEELATRGVLADQALEEARARAAGARDRLATTLNASRASIAALSSARAQLAQAATAVSESLVRAPFAGEIAERSVSVGGYVSPQTPLVTLVRTDPLRIEMVVPQQHLLDVQAGQRVLIRVDAIPDRSFEGTIRYVSAVVSAASRGLTVEAVVPNPDGVLRPGLFVSARVETGQARSVALIPSAAVLTEAGVSRVFVVTQGRIEERVVATGDVDGDLVVVTEGLMAGEVVAGGDLELLADGQRVEG